MIGKRALARQLAASTIDGLLSATLANGTPSGGSKLRPAGADANEVPA